MLRMIRNTSNITNETENESDMESNVDMPNTVAQRDRSKLKRSISQDSGSVSPKNKQSHLTKSTSNRREDTNSPDPSSSSVQSVTEGVRALSVPPGPGVGKRSKDPSVLPGTRVKEGVKVSPIVPPQGDKRGDLSKQKPREIITPPKQQSWR